MKKILIFVALLIATKIAVAGKIMDRSISLTIDHAELLFYYDIKSEKAKKLLDLILYLDKENEKALLLKAKLQNNLKIAKPSAPIDVDFTVANLTVTAENFKRVGKNEKSLFIYKVCQLLKGTSEKSRLALKKAVEQGINTEFYSLLKLAEESDMDKPKKTLPKPKKATKWKFKYITSKGWYTSDIGLEKGDEVSIEVSGNWSPDKGRSKVDADGAIKPQWQKYKFYGKVKHGLFIARISGDASKIYPIGKEGSFIAESSGVLSMAVNDSGYGDNIGVLDVIVNRKR